MKVAKPHPIQKNKQLSIKKSPGPVSMARALLLSKLIDSFPAQQRQQGRHRRAGNQLARRYPAPRRCAGVVSGSPL